MSDYIVRDFKEADKIQVTALLQSAFDPNMTREYWEWLYPKNPNGYYIVVAEKNGEIVGHDGFIPLRVKIGKQELMAVFNASLVVSPEHRGKEVFLKMGIHATTRLAEAQKPVCIGFPNEAAHPGHLRYGWVTVSSMTKYVKLLNGRALMKTKKVRTVLERYHLARIKILLQPVLTLLLEFAHLQARSKFRIERGPHEYDVIVSRTPFPQKMDDLWAKAKDYYEILTVRDTEYLNWRFHKCPDGEYIVLIGKAKGEFVGYLVASQRGDMGLILDIFGEADAALFDALIRKATHLLKNAGVEKVITRITSNSEASKAFQHNGWWKEGSIPIIARVNVSGKNLEADRLKAYLCNPSNWFTTASDNL